MAPRDAGRQTSLVDYQTLHNEAEIQLVSATDDEPSDLALAAVARREGVEFLLRGEVIEGRNETADDGEHDSLTISWCLTSLQNGSTGGGIPITIDTEQAVDRYPDLALSSSRDEVLTTAAVQRELSVADPFDSARTSSNRNRLRDAWQSRRASRQCGRVGRAMGRRREDLVRGGRALSDTDSCDS